MGQLGALLSCFSRGERGSFGDEEAITGAEDASQEQILNLESLVALDGKVWARAR